MKQWENQKQWDTEIPAIQKKITCEIAEDEEEEEDDDDDDDDNDDNDDADDDDDDDDYEVDILLVLDSDDSKSVPPWTYDLSLVPASFLHPDLLKEVQQIFTIVETRCNSYNTCSERPDYEYPLTTCDVKRIFSKWKRLLDRNANTRASTMRGLVLLSCFEHDELVSILKDFPSTEASDALVAKLLTSERRFLDERAFHALKLKTQTEHQKRTPKKNVPTNVYQDSPPV